MYPSREQINHERKQFLKQKIMEFIGDDMKTSVQLAKLIGVERYHLKYALMDLEAEGLLHHEPRGSKLYLYYKPKRHPLDEIFNHNLNIPEDKIIEVHTYTEKDAKHNLRHNVTVDSFGESALASEGVKVGI
jgi:hypothetical protein